MALPKLKTMGIDFDEPDYDCERLLDLIQEILESRKDNFCTIESGHPN